MSMNRSLVLTPIIAENGKDEVGTSKPTLAPTAGRTWGTGILVIGRLVRRRGCDQGPTKTPRSRKPRDLGHPDFPDMWAELSGAAAFLFFFCKQFEHVAV